jgi:arylsulfatase A-like enzyme/tetratricopeptide (TPR) repeat protein
VKRITKARLFLLLGLLSAVLGLGAFFGAKARNERLARTPAAAARAPAGPNVLLITVDTLRADALGSYGNREAATPVLDRLAAAGVRFSNAYAHNVVTLPSHANILSGRLPFEHGVRDNSGFRLPARTETLATLLKARGYQTGAFVSAFPLDSRFGLDRGFDLYEDSFADAARPAFLEQERSGIETVRLARQWIGSRAGQPYFCWVHLYEPHFPYKPPEELAARFAGRGYDGEVAAVDAALAPLLEPILTAGAAGKTLVVFTADHGESLGEHGEASHGIFAYQATLRVPLVLYDPPLWDASVVRMTAGHIDLLPTVLDALDLAVPADLPGRSLIPAIQKGTAPERPVYFEALSGMLNRGWAPLRGVVSGDTKYIELPIPELYDLARDPGEMENRFGADRERAQSMRALLAKWPAADRATRSAPETGEVRERLRSLGYVASTTTPRSVYTEEDDPKRLIALDAVLQEVVTRYLDGDLSGALHTCRELVARRPKMVVSLLYLAHLERETGNLPAGIDALRRALAMTPDNAETASLLGAYLTDAGRAAEAIRVLEPFAGTANPDPQVLLADGLALARAGRAAEALSALDRARQADPSNAAVLVHVGTVQLMGGRTAEARSAFEQALAINPSLARAHSSLGAIAAEANERERALAHWRQAVALDPGEFRTVLGVAVALANRGRQDDARPYVEFFVSAAPPARFGPDIARARTWLATH